MTEKGGKTSRGSNSGLSHNDWKVFTKYTTLPDISSRIFRLWRELVARPYRTSQIPWILFARNDIGNYGLISNTNGARDQNIIYAEN